MIGGLYTFLNKKVLHLQKEAKASIYPSYSVFQLKGIGLLKYPFKSKPKDTCTNSHFFFLLFMNFRKSWRLFTLFSQKTFLSTPLKRPEYVHKKKRLGTIFYSLGTLFYSLGTLFDSLGANSKKGICFLLFMKVALPVVIS